MKKALIIAYYFPPTAASGAQRPLGLLRHLGEYGYAAHVACAHPDDVYPALQQDDSSVLQTPAHARVDYVRHRNQLQRLLELRARLRRWFGHSDALLANAAQTEQRGVDVSESMRQVLIDWFFAFPDQQKYWGRALTKHVRALTGEARPDLIFATANPWSSLLVGLRLSRKLDIPFVADFRDPWRRNPKPQAMLGLMPKLTRLETKVVSGATRVVANTKQLAEALVADYPQCADKVCTVTNGYLEAEQPVQPWVAHRTAELCHFGSVYPLRKPLVLLEALNDLVRAGNIRRDSFKLRFVGGWDVEDQNCDALAANLESMGFVQRDKPVSREQAQSMMLQSPHLLILQQSFPLQIPAKLYDYVALKRPIVVIGGDGATSELVTKERLGICVPDRREEIRTLIARLAGGEQMVAPPDDETIARFSYRHIAGQMAGVFDSALDNFR